MYNENNALFYSKEILEVNFENKVKLEVFLKISDFSHFFLYKVLFEIKFMGNLILDNFEKPPVYTY